MNRHERNTLVESNIPLVGYLVNKVMAGATHLSRDDLAQAGFVALIQAADSFEEERGVPFGAFARERIIGGFKDEMRNADWAKRSTRRQIKETLVAEETLATQLGRKATVDEVAGVLGVSRATASEGMQFAHRTVTTLDATYHEQLTADVVLPGQDLIVQERVAALHAGISALPDKLRYVVEEIYLNNRTVGELADELGVTHSAVSQQRTEAMKLLREGFDVHYSDTDDDQQNGEVIPLKSSSRRNQYLNTFAEKLSEALPVRPMAVAI